MCQVNTQKSEMGSTDAVRKNVPFETALNLAGFGKYNWYIFFVCSMAMLGSVMELYGLSFIVQTAACDLQLGLEERGILSATPMVGVICSAYFWGYLTDTKGRKSVLLISMTLAFIASFLSSFSPNMITLTILKFISISFGSASFATTYTFLGEFLPKKYRDNLLVMLTCGNILAELVISLIAYPILNYSQFEYAIPFLEITFRPWRFLVIMLSSPIAVSAICLIFTHESPKFLMAQDREEEAIKVLRSMHKWNTGLDDYPVVSLSFNEELSVSKTNSLFRLMWQKCVPLFQKKYLKYTIMLYYLVFWISVVSNTFAMWLPYIVNRFTNNLNVKGLENENFCGVFNNNPQSKLNITEMNDKFVYEECDDSINLPTILAIGSYSVIGCLFNIFLALILRCVSKKVAAISLLTCTATCGFISYWVHSPIAGFLLVMLLTFEFFAMGIIPIFLVDIYPTHVRGMAGCLSIMFGRLGAFLGILMTGIVFEPHCDITIFVLSVIVFISASVSFALPSST